MKRLLSLILILCALFSLPSCGSGKKTTVVVKVAGEVVARLPLSEDTELTIRGVGGENHLVIRDGKAWVASADCKNQVCVHTGKIDSSSILSMITCLPHEVVIFLEGGSK